jgi:hypothetical protein
LVIKKEYQDEKVQSETAAKVERFLWDHETARKHEPQPHKVTLFSGKARMTYNPLTKTYRITGESLSGATTIEAEIGEGHHTITINNNLDHAECCHL